MRYASIRSLDISNGTNIGVALFTQGCDRHCYNCFNPETWDFNGGKVWTEETKNKFLELIDRPYIKRVSILGGEPLAEQNLDGVLDLIKEIREKYPISQNADLENPYKSRVSEPQNGNEIRLSFPEKTIWLYTGYYVYINYPESHRQHKVAMSTSPNASTNIIYDNDLFLKKKEEDRKRSEIISLCNVIVDGEYIDEQRDITLAYRGSKNQRVISVQESLAQNKMVLYCD